PHGSFPGPPQSPGSAHEACWLELASMVTTATMTAHEAITQRARLCPAAIPHNERGCIPDPPLQMTCLHPQATLEQAESTKPHDPQASTSGSSASTSASRSRSPCSDGIPSQPEQPDL